MALDACVQIISRAGDKSTVAQSPDMLWESTAVVRAKKLVNSSTGHRCSISVIALGGHGGRGVSSDVEEMRNWDRDSGTFLQVFDIADLRRPTLLSRHFAFA